MISGRFGEIGELIFEIDLIASDEEKFPIDVLLDTGFTTGFLVLDSQDAESLGWSIIESNRTMQMARGEELFDIYEGRVVLNQQEYIIPVVAYARNSGTSTWFTVVENVATCCRFYSRNFDFRVNI